MLKRFARNNKGFTLVELMIVVVIIGVLIAIAVPIYNSSTASAEANACKANQRTIEAAIMQWRAANNRTDYPSDWNQLVGPGLYLTEQPYCGTEEYNLTIPVTCPRNIPSHQRGPSSSTSPSP